MTEAHPVTIPLLNPNEPEAMLASLQVRAGQQVAAGDLLCTLETTKSTADVVAESAGYVAGLRFSQGQTVRAGEILCYLAPTSDWEPPQVEVTARPETQGPALPVGLRITLPALELARQHELDLERLPVGPLVTERAVRALLEPSTLPGFITPAGDFDPTAIVVYGGGGHGKSLIDLLRALGVYRIAGVIDDGMPPGAEIMGLPVLGGAHVLAELRAEGVRLAVNAVGGIGNVKVRVEVFERLETAGFTCPAVIHPAAYVEPSASLSAGVQVFAHAYVGSEARVGFGSIINTGAILSHDCILGEYVNISPGAILAGAVKVGDRALVGMGATVNLEAEIGSGARIGNGATVKSSVPDNSLVRAGSIYP